MAAFLLLAAALVGVHTLKHIALEALLAGVFLLIILICVGVITIIVRRRQKMSQLKSMQLASDIDMMNSAEFETYIMTLLKARGYHARRAHHIIDHGVDIIANRGRERIGVQTRRSAHKLDHKTVQHAVAGAQLHRSQATMVITNNYFTERAQQEGALHHCVLIDRDTLTKWIAEFQG